MRVPRDSSPRLKKFARDLRRNLTEAEQRLWSRLRQHQLNGERFRRQYPISGYIVDFYNLKNRLAIELDGGQHYDVENVERDMRRDECLRSLGVTTLRFSNVDVLRDTEAVVVEISKAYRPLHFIPPPQPSPEYRRRGKVSRIPMPRPFIGITTDYNDKLSSYDSPYGYSTAVEKAGGLPILLPYRADLSLIPQYVDLIDGIVFSGGDDLDPKSWGETYHPKTSPVDPLREKFEIALMTEVEKRRMPTLGICMGSQLMNVHRGGSLHQFLPEMDRKNALEHRKVGGDGLRSSDAPNRHPVTLQTGSAAEQVIGKTQIVSNTSHKQSVNKLGRGLRIIATAPDGVVEGIEDPSMPLFLGVQWHPERLHNEADHLALFRLLVQRAAVAAEAGPS